LVLVEVELIMYTEDVRYPFVVVLEEKDLSQKVEMWRWCVEQWGRPSYNKPLNWNSENRADEYYDEYIFKFVNEKDRTWFIIRWST
jgi:hypothetical protein